jgi:predicted nucleic acid-binding protein
MSHYFVDSSALIKRYIAEVGTHWMRSIVNPIVGNIIIIAHITQVEVVSGIMRRKRDGNITPRTARATRLLLDRHTSRQYKVISLSAPIVQRAEDLLEAHLLRAYDSIQLASALEINSRFVAAGLPPITFISADNRLVVAANTEGLTTDDPNAYP